MTTRPIALVTGPTAGIGNVFARKLADRGYDLILVARDGARLATLAAELTAHGTAATVVAADLTTEAGVVLAEQAIANAPRLDLLVNNAGFGTRGGLAEAPQDAQEQMLRLHVVAVYRVTRAALQRMQPAKRGGIVNVASVASFVNSTGNVNYCATKAFQRSFSEGLSLECAQYSVRVQALCPGFTRTEFHQRMDDNQGDRAPDWMWLSADYVVETSLAQLERDGGVICVPGFKYKVAVFLARHLPFWVKRRLTGSVYKRD
jgi:uncharacterized protein